MHEYNTNRNLLFLYFRAKKTDSENRRDTYRTGGGAPPVDLPAETEKVLSVIGPELLDIGNPYDLDAMPATGEVLYGCCFDCSVCELCS